MTEPNTVNKGLIIPNTGDLPGTWGSAALNPDYAAIDGMLGGFATVSLTNANVTLTAPAGSIAPAGGPNQSQNAQIIFTGTLTGNCVITFPLPGFYIVKNNCTVGAFYVQATTGAGGGKNIGLPPGRSLHIFSNGTDVEFVNMPDVGSYWDYAGATVPAWITACSVLPWLVCDGSTPLIATYPVLAGIVGQAFGGNGISTFGLPDLRNRVRVAIDTNPGGGFSNRVTTAGSGINGQALAAAGGDQALQSHTHAATVSPNPHNHGISTYQIQGLSTGAGTTFNNGVPIATTTDNVTLTVTNASVGAGAGQNMQPSLIAGVAFIKT